MKTPLDLTIEAVQATPPVTVASIVLLGYSLNEWALIGSLLLIVLQIFFLLKKNLYDKKD